MIDPRHVMPGQEHAAHEANLYEALTRISEASEKIGEHTGQLSVHSEQLKVLNDHLVSESKEREKGDKDNRRFTLIMAIFTCLLTFALDHISDIAQFFKELFR